MPSSYQIDSDSMLVDLSLTGSVDTWEVQRVFGELARDARLRPGFDLIVDLSEAEGATTTPETRRNLSYGAMLTDRIGPVRCAVVAPRDANYGMANAAAVYASDSPGLRLAAFRSRSEAEAWIREEREGDA